MNVNMNASASYADAETSIFREHPAITLVGVTLVCGVALAAVLSSGVIGGHDSSINATYVLPSQYAQTSGDMTSADVLSADDAHTVKFTIEGPGHLEGMKDCSVNGETGEIYFTGDDPEDYYTFRLYADMEPGVLASVYLGDKNEIYINQGVVQLKKMKTAENLKIRFQPPSTTEEGQKAINEAKKNNNDKNVSEQPAEETPAPEANNDAPAVEETAPVEETPVATPDPEPEPEAVYEETTTYVESPAPIEEETIAYEVLQDTYGDTGQGTVVVEYFEPVTPTTEEAPIEVQQPAKKKSKKKKAAQTETVTQETTQQSATVPAYDIPVPQTTPHKMNDKEMQLARAIFDSYNNYRASKGLPTLPWSDVCANMAYGSSTGCSAHNQLIHRLGIPTYVQNHYSDILQYSTWKMEADEAVSKWIASDGHRKMMQCDNAHNAGVGVYQNDTGKWFYTIVYDFEWCNQSGS